MVGTEATTAWLCSNLLEGRENGKKEGKKESKKERKEGRKNVRISPPDFSVCFLGGGRGRRKFY